MKILINISVILTALEFLFIFYIETIATTSERTSSTFNIPISELKRSSLNILFKNQGVYNLIIAVMLMVGLFVLHSKEVVILFLLNIVIVAAYGGFTSSPKIFIKQSGLAIISLLLIMVSGIL